MQSQSTSLFPKGYFNIFGSEFSARFSFWAIQSIIVLYLTQRFLISDSSSYTIAASYEALTYAATFFGGLVADKYFGPLKILLTGIILSTLGMLVLLLPQQHAVYFGLAILVIGMGLYMPTNAALLDHLYKKTDLHRERGYFYFYVATNLGGIFGPLVFGLIVEYGSYFLGFLFCALLLALFLTSYVVTWKRVAYLHYPAIKQSYKKDFILLIGLIILTVAIYFLISRSNLTRDLLIATGISAVVWILFSSRHDADAVKKKVYLIMFFSIVSLVFYAFEFQVLNSVITFTRDFVNKRVFGFDVPTSSFVSLEPFFVVATTPVISILIEKLKIKKIELNIFQKFGVSFLLLALCFLILSLAAKYYDATHQLVSPIWLVLASLFMGAGEVFLMPVLLALVTKDSPEKLKNSMVGFLYLCISFSSYLSGVIANFTSVKGNNSPVMAYSETFGAIFVCIFILGILLFVINIFMSKAKRS